MRTPLEKNQNVPANSPRREFVTRSALWVVGAVATATVGSSRLFARNTRKSDSHDETDSFQAFDCHLHCPAENGEKWQWYKVSNSFEDFVSYLDKTGVQRGIINSQRSFETKPEEFMAGNREVARYVEKYKGRFIGACVVNPLYIEESLKGD